MQQMLNRETKELEFVEGRDYVVNKQGCHLWLREISKNGYAILTKPASGLTPTVHRCAYEQAFPDVDIEFKILHHNLTCPKNCINPEHLTPMTYAEHNLLHKSKPFLVCRTCKQELPREDFDVRLRNGSPRGMKHSCRACNARPTRKCTKCGEVKHREEFDRFSNGRLKQVCRICS